MTAAAVLGLLPPNIGISEGSILFSGNEMTAMHEKDKRKIRGKEIAYIFQNYQGSFTPFIKIGKQPVEAIVSHRKIGKENAKEEALLTSFHGNHRSVGASSGTRKNLYYD